MTLLKGKMERKSGVRKQFIERFYVLSQGKKKKKRDSNYYYKN
jgi:hypothetical protein